jgi:hypothetical protein
MQGLDDAITCQRGGEGEWYLLCFAASEWMGVCSERKTDPLAGIELTRWEVGIAGTRRLVFGGSGYWWPRGHVARDVGRLGVASSRSEPMHSRFVYAVWSAIRGGCKWMSIEVVAYLRLPAH